MIIANLYVRGGKISVSAPLPRRQDDAASLLDIHLKDIGKEKKGVSPGAVADKVLASIGDGAKSAEGVGGAIKGLFGK